MEMILRQPHPKRWENPTLLAESDEKGSYTIDGIPTGDYDLGINIGHTPTKDQPYAPTYCPATEDVRAAISISFLTGPSVPSYDLTGPLKLKVVRVRGRISDAAGSPPKDHPHVPSKSRGYTDRSKPNL